MISKHFKLLWTATKVTRVNAQRRRKNAYAEVVKKISEKRKKTWLPIAQLNLYSRSYSPMVSSDLFPRLIWVASRGKNRMQISSCGTGERKICRQLVTQFSWNCHISDWENFEHVSSSSYPVSLDKIFFAGEIRQLVAEYCILPLATDNVRLLSPLVRSVLIAGPHASGKKMLVHAVCTELGATLFDITPANIAGKYPGKSGLIMLLHLISKVLEYQ